MLLLDCGTATHQSWDESRCRCVEIFPFLMRTAELGDVTETGFTRVTSEDKPTCRRKMASIIHADIKMSFQ
jgi:hypothetical protein